MNLHFALVTHYNLTNASAWSGTPHHMYRALARKVRTHILTSPAVLSKHITRRKARYRGDAGFLWTRSLEAAQLLSLYYKDTLRTNSYTDILCFNPSEAAFLQTTSRVSIIVDATWRQFTSRYEQFETFCEETLAEGFIGERLGFERCSNIICFTQWAARAIEHEYPEHRHKIICVLPGANLANPLSSSQVSSLIKQRWSERERRFLFIGSSPTRKGFDLAVEACAQLRRFSVPVYLDAAGFDYSSYKLLPGFVSCHGRLDKRDCDQSQRLVDLYTQAYAFLLPTRAECAGIVLAEAAAYGLPTVLSGVDGTQELVVAGVTGLVMGDNADPCSYARALAHLSEDANRYTSMAEAARRRFDSTLNWNVFVRAFLSHISSEFSPEQ